MAEYFYCNRWFRAKKRLITSYTEAEARELHAKGNPYCVLVSSADRPCCLLEVTFDFVSVGFLDDHLRENLSYQFQEIGPGKLFLSMATWRDFENETDKIVEGTTYLFEPGGSLNIRKETFVPQYAIETAESRYDPDSHWEPYPVFGHYGDFTKRER